MAVVPIDISGSKVLVVDDTPANIDLFCEILEQDGLEVSYATNGKQAIKLASLDQPDLILMDIMMPEMSGIETCRRLKSLKDTRDIPIVFITAKTSRDDVAEGFKVGGVDYISKPIQQEELSARVHCHLKLQALVKIRDELIRSLRAHNEKIEELVIEQNEQLLQAEKLAAIGESVGEFTHEINTPVGIALTTLSYLQDETYTIKNKFEEESLDKEDFNNFIEASLESCGVSHSNLTRALGLIKSFKRITIDQCSDKQLPFNLRECIEDVIDSLHPKLKRTEHQINIECRSDIEIRSYPGAFAQIIINLVNNSILHAYEPEHYGRFDIIVTLDNDFLQLQYSDDGKGISEEELEKIFEKYYTTKQERGGSGLGLYIVRNLVEEKLNGSLECKGNLGAGCEFLIKIPESEIVNEPED